MSDLGERGLVPWLNTQLAARPFAFNSAFSGFVSVLAELLRHILTDGICQPPDLMNMARQLLLGSSVITFLATTWYGQIVPNVFRNFDQRRISTVLAQTFAEQAFFAPTVNATFMVCLGLLEGRTPKEVRGELCTKFFPVWRSNIGFWAPVGLINYKFVPGNLQAMFAKVASVFWMLYLINKTSKASEVKTSINQPRHVKSDQKEKRAL